MEWEMYVFSEQNLNYSSAITDAKTLDQSLEYRFVEPEKRWTYTLVGGGSDVYWRHF